MNPQPVTLTGQFVRLEPLRPDHAPELFAASSPDLFEHLLRGPDEWSLAGFERLVARLISQPRVPFAIIALDTGRVVGCTSYLNIRPEHRGLEIGTTWIARNRHSTAVNPESKLLLMRHAFETLEAVRVEYLVSVLNLRSQRAVAKLGAVREGVMRNRWVLPSGAVRDCVVFSVTQGEWPEVRARLEERLRG